MASTLHVRASGPDSFEVIDRQPGPYSASGPIDLPVFRVTAEDAAVLVQELAGLGILVPVSPLEPPPAPADPVKG